jgi:hypothetical protein
VAVTAANSTIARNTHASITVWPSSSSSPDGIRHGAVAQVAHEDRCFGPDTSTSTTSKKSWHAGTHSSLSSPVDPAL